MKQVVFKVFIEKEGSVIHSFDLKSVDQLVGAFSILQTGMSLRVDCDNFDVEVADSVIRTSSKGA